MYESPVDSVAVSKECWSMHRTHTQVHVWNTNQQFIITLSFAWSYYLFHQLNINGFNYGLQGQWKNRTNKQNSTQLIALLRFSIRTKNNIWLSGFLSNEELTVWRRQRSTDHEQTTKWFIHERHCLFCWLKCEMNKKKLDFDFLSLCCTTFYIDERAVAFAARQYTQLHTIVYNTV